MGKPRRAEPSRDDASPLRQALSLRPALAAAWWDRHHRWVRAIEADLPPERRPFLRYEVAWMVDQRAWLVAQRLARNPRCGASVTLSAEDVQAAGRPPSPAMSALRPA
jgi:hypothetical protein